MSRIDHIVARRQESPRAVRPQQKMRTVFDTTARKITQAHLPYHKQGNTWWRTRFADLVERRLPDGTHAKRQSPTIRAASPPQNVAPEILPRPEGMTRQVHRRLFREACKYAGVARASRGKQ